MENGGQRVDGMLIAQITDVHIGFDVGNPTEFNRVRLDQLIATLRTGPNVPDLLLATGDLADNGALSSYQIFADAIAGVPFAVLPCVGNHDRRANFLTVFPSLADENGFVQYVHDCGAFRLIIIDTLDEGRHGGAFCAARAKWLRARLAEKPDLPTWIVMHHPPFDSGLEWMTTDPAEPWVARFIDAIADAPGLRGMFCGHLHRALVMPWRGLTVAVCASSAPQVALDLRPIDADQPDDRAMIVAEDPGYALHHWNGEGLVSFFERAGDAPVLASYDRGMQGLVRHLINERPGHGHAAI